MVIQRIRFLISILFILLLFIALPCSFALDDISIKVPSEKSGWQFFNTSMSMNEGGWDLSLTNCKSSVDSSTELLLSFDDEKVVDSSGRWIVANEQIEFSPSAKYGSGAASFKAPSSSLTLQPTSKTHFLANYPCADMSIEFWLKPSRADSGEIVLMWKSTRKDFRKWMNQQFTGLIIRNRMTFAFLNFFKDPSGKETTINVKGKTVIIPNRWSHHLLRFDSSTGLLEYLMDGKIEDVQYITSTGKQSGDIFLPVAGASGHLEVGQNYTGLLDELKISSKFVNDITLSKYNKEGGSIISEIIDLGETDSELNAINIKYFTPLETDVHFFFRYGNDYSSWNETKPEWLPFIPQEDLSSKKYKARYIQIKMLLFPDASCEVSPEITSLSLDYKKNNAPGAPYSILATNGNEEINIRWTKVSETDVAGYLIYYGNEAGQYFGNDALEGESPIIVNGADVSSFKLSGLTNGKLYFIAVAAFDDANPPHIGNNSTEVSSRPSRMIK